MRGNRAPLGVLNLWINITPPTPVCRLARLMQTYTRSKTRTRGCHAHSRSRLERNTRPTFARSRASGAISRLRPSAGSTSCIQTQPLEALRSLERVSTRSAGQAFVVERDSGAAQNATARHGPRSALGNQLVGALAARFPSSLCAPTVQRSGRRRVRTPGCWARGADASRGSELTRRSSVGWLPASQHRGSAPLVAVLRRLRPFVGVCAQSANNALEQ